MPSDSSTKLRLGRLASRGHASENRQVGKAMIAVGILTLLVAISGALRDIAVAARFGTSGALDALLIALVLPTFGISVLVGSLASAFLPTYVRVREREGIACAHRLFSSASFLLIGLLAACSLFLCLGGYLAMPLLGSGFTPSQLAQARSLFLILVPVLLIKGVSTVWAAGLNAINRLALPASSPALVPGAVVLLLLLDPKPDIYRVAVGLVLGYAIEAAVLAVSSHRHGFVLIPRWYGFTPELRQMIRQYAPVCAGSFIMSSTVLVDQAMAAALPQGNVSTLHFGSKLVMLVLSVAYVGLGTALLPHYSRMVARRDWLGIRATVRLYASVIIACSIPLIMILVWFGEPLIGMLFQRGEFSAADRAHVARVQIFYALQIPFYLLNTLLVRLISSLRANHILMWGAALNLPVNIVLNYVFMQRWGVAGIALSTSVVYLLSCIFLTLMILRYRRHWQRVDYEGRS